MKPAAAFQRWRQATAAEIDQAAVLTRVQSDSGWSNRYAFMILMSAGIAILGLLLSSPAVIIGAMLISPLMAPIIGLGFALAVFDWAEVRRSLLALAMGSLLAVAFAALVVAASPLYDVTSEILARTRPNLFDLLVAVFSALAGTYATIRGRGETIVGVAIATALMPPLAVVGFGLATSNLAIFGGSLALFFTNFIAIALSATFVARFYGFDSNQSAVQTRRQTIWLILLLIALAIPLALSLRQIAWEAFTARTIRSALAAEFGPDARVGALEPDFASQPLHVRATVFTEQFRKDADATLTELLGSRIGQPVDLQLNQIIVNQDMASLESDRSRLAEADRLSRRTGLSTQLAALTGAPPERILIDEDARTALIRPLEPLPLSTWQQLESRLGAANPEWTISIIPPLTALPSIPFEPQSTEPGASALAAIETIEWALQRWGIKRLELLVAKVSDEPDASAADRQAVIASSFPTIASLTPPPASIDREAELATGRDARRAVTVRILPEAEERPLAPEVANSSLPEAGR